MAHKVAAKFWVQKVTKTKASAETVSREVILAPSLRKSDDNVQWSKYTPAGEIRLVITADGAGEWFEEHLGQDIDITFELSPNQVIPVG